MISLKANIAPIAAQLRLLAGGLPRAVDDGIEAALTEALTALEARTPVRTGHMQASWFLEHDGPGQFTFGDAADYASYVRKRQRDQAIEQELDNIETVLTDTLGATITHYLGAAE